MYHWFNFLFMEILSLFILQLLFQTSILKCLVFGFICFSIDKSRFLYKYEYLCIKLSLFALLADFLTNLLIFCYFETMEKAIVILFHVRTNHLFKIMMHEGGTNGWFIWWVIILNFWLLLIRIPITYLNLCNYI